ncbi:hypothetical protein MiSe_84780 [Microseira wollei NIES-4236]|uniref:Uncharacterized protein n=1 Tax=Microseira wollei NIES-4236 TaxID=2530354 RepID=A0AAV3XMW5_9CYAN|nr:hypothetical protein MiSe_84780 [Microseira wollei NIES-4236]
MWINQTIRNTNAKTKAKHFKRMWLEVSNQGFEVVKSGDLYTVSFSLYRSRKGRIPLEVHAAWWFTNRILLSWTHNLYKKAKLFPANCL